jgi:hypothetical protein
MYQQANAGRMVPSFVLAVAVVLLTGCATPSLQGIPSGLSKAERTTLMKAARTDVINVTQSLYDTYESARNTNLKFAYWSNVPFIIAGTAAAAAIFYKAHRDTLAGIGIASGALGTFNTFTNSRANAKVYQSGMNALVCVQTRLGPFLQQISDSNLKAGRDVLTREVINAEQALTNAKAVLQAKNAADEQKKNGGVVTQLAEQQHALSLAVAAARTAITAANAELTYYARLPAVVAMHVQRIDTKVASKVTQSDISFADARKNALDLTTAPDAAPKPPAPAAKPTTASEASKTPIKDAIDDFAERSVSLQTKTAQLKELIANFALVARNEEAEACVNAI